MATAQVTGTLRDFGGANLSDPRMWAHPERPGYTAPDRLLSDQPVPISVSSDGTFSAPLEEHHVYRFEVQDFDPGHDRIARTWWSEPFRVPSGGGAIAEIIGLPYRTGMIRILQEPPSSGIFDQYTYNEATGDLYERIS